MHPAPAVSLHRLSKSFAVRRPRAGGLAARIQDFVAPQTRPVIAVDDLWVSN
jgi:hypothetical protein